jgi:nitroreductase
MDLSEVMRTAGAARAFTAEPVADVVLHRVLDHARFAPSGGNRQGWDVVVVHDTAIRTAVRDLCVLGWREYMAHVEKGLVPFAPTDHGRWTGPAVDLEAARAVARPAPFVDTLDTVPVMLVITARLDQLAVLDNGLDRQSIVGGGSIYPFVQNLVLAARNEGLGSAVTTFLVRQEATARELLHIPSGVAIASLVAMGHPVKQVTKLRRRAVEEFAHVDTYDGPAFTA